MDPRIFLMAAVVFAAAGQVLFKKGMLLMGNISLAGNFLHVVKTTLSIVFSPVVFIGLVLYALSTILWLFALSKTTLNYAYPFTTLTFILVMAASFFLLSEPFPVNRVIGGAVVCLGVIICSIKI